MLRSIKTLLDSWLSGLRPDYPQTGSATETDLCKALLLLYRSEFTICLLYNGVVPLPADLFFGFLCAAIVIVDTLVCSTGTQL